MGEHPLSPGLSVLEARHSEKGPSLFQGAQRLQIAKTRFMVWWRQSLYLGLGPAAPTLTGAAKEADQAPFWRKVSERGDAH